MADGSIRFFTDLSTAGFESGAKRLQSVSASTASGVANSFKGIGASIAGIATAFIGVHTAINAFRSALDMTDRLSELSKATGESAGNLAILERAFDNAGLGAQKVGPMFGKMSAFIADLEKGTPRATATAELLGVTLESLKGKAPIDQFGILFRSVGNVADENQRAAVAGDLFGEKLGTKLVPLSRDWNKELENATQELGSTVRLLNENSGEIENMGDKLNVITTKKLPEFIIGLASGATGANNLVEALSKIDAAGLGERLGQALRAAFAAPMEVVRAIGEFLIAGVLEAGNRLKAAMQFAVDTYFNMMQNPGFWNGFKEYVGAIMAAVGKSFVDQLIPLLKSAISLMDWNPFWRPFTNIAKEQLSILQQKVTEAGGRIEVAMMQGSLQMEAAFKEGRKDAEYIYEDALGAAKHYEQGWKHLENAQKAAANIKVESQTTEENFNKGSTALAKVLAELRGFNLTGGPPLPMPGAIPPPSGGPLAPPGGGGGLPPPSPPPSGGGGGGGGGGIFAPATAAGTATMASLSSNVTFQGRPANNYGEAWQGTINNNFGGSKMAALNWLKNTPTYNPQQGEEANMANALKGGALPPNPPPGGPGGPGGGGGGGGAGSGAGGAGQGGGAGGPGGPGGGNPPGGPPAPEPNLLQEIVTDIYNLLDERLPIQALV